MPYYISNKYTKTLTILCHKCNCIGYDISTDEYFNNIEQHNNWKCSKCAIEDNQQRQKNKYNKVLKNIKKRILHRKENRKIDNSTPPRYDDIFFGGLKELNNQ